LFITFLDLAPGGRFKVGDKTAADEPSTGTGSVSGAKEAAGFCVSV
jgi:hypothetical protein